MSLLNVRRCLIWRHKRFHTCLRLEPHLSPQPWLQQHKHSVFSKTNKKKSCQYQYPSIYCFILIRIAGFPLDWSPDYRRETHSHIRTIWFCQKKMKIAQIFSHSKILYYDFHLPWMQTFISISVLFHLVYFYSVYPFYRYERYCLRLTCTIFLIYWSSFILLYTDQP